MGTGDEGVARDSRAGSVTVVTADESPDVRMADRESSLLASGTVMVRMESEPAAVEVTNEEAVVSG